MNPGAEALVLACLTEPGSPGTTTDRWARLLAPEVSLRTVPPDEAAIAALAGPTPYALLGAGPLGATCVELAARLAGSGCGPCALVLCQCPAPDAEPLAPGCPVLVLADAASANDLARWRTSAGQAGFTLRLTTPDAVPPRGPADPALALALKEELRVWPR